MSALAERAGDERVRGHRSRALPPARTGVLVLHGFTGTPLSVLAWAQAFEAAGCDVEVPLLPGHATTPADCDRTGWADWLAAAERALAALDGHERVVVAGLSMGGALALRLAQLHPQRVHAVVVANPAVALHPAKALAVAVLGRVLPSWPAIAGDLADPGASVLAYERTPLRALVSQTGGWREVRRELHRVTQPLLVLRSRTDHVVPASSARRVLVGVRSREVTEVVYDGSFHELTSDADAPAVFADSVAFVRRVSSR